MKLPFSLLAFIWHRPSDELPYPYTRDKFEFILQPLVTVV